MVVPVTSLCKFHFLNLPISIIYNFKTQMMKLFFDVSIIIVRKLMLAKFNTEID